MRSKVLLALAAAVASLGSLAGTALANPVYNGGVQTPLPVVRPAAAAFTVPLLLAQAAPPPMGYTVLGVFAGRDDTSPWAGFEVMWPAGQPGTAGFPALAGWFVYRPLWDPLTVNLPAAPATNVDFESHWVAVQFAFGLFQQARTAAMAPPVPGVIPQIFLWCDPAALAFPVGPLVNVGMMGTQLHNYEFYKFMIGT